MNKKEVQRRVLKNGKPLALDLFSWDKDTLSFLSKESGLVIDFKNAHSCTVTTGSDCTVTTGSKCVIIRKDEFEVIQPKEGDIINTCPYNIPGHLVNGMYKGEPHVIADGILSKVIRKRGDVYKVITHGQEEESYLIKSGNDWAHGETLKQARECLLYKTSDRDKSEFLGKTVNDVLSKADCIAMYRVVTGACELGVRSFVKSLDNVKDQYALSEIIEITKGRFGHDEFKRFLSTNAV